VWLAVALAVAAACGSAASPTPAPTLSPSSTATLEVPSPSPTPTSMPTPTPGPTTTTVAPAASAYQFVQGYAEALLGGRYDVAWLRLGADCQARWGTLAAFTKERTAFMKAAGGAYTLKISPTNTLSLSDWIVGQSWASKIDQANAYLFSLRWTGYGTNPAGTEIWIANPTPVSWQLYRAN
jgi:hypothetical protein